jgi:transcriptional regulator with XRE-family HTH domain
MTMSRTQIDGPQQPTAAFGAVVRRRRRALGLSQKKLGERCGLTQEYISGIERGTRNPTLKSIWTLAEGLDASAGALLLEAEEKMPSEE